MNDNANYILELLRSGMSADDIAKQMADALNEATVAHKAEETAKREAEEKAKLAKEEEAKREEKREYLAGEVARAIKTYFEEIYPEECAGLELDGFIATFVKTAEEMIKLRRKLKEFEENEDLDELLGLFGL